MIFILLLILQFCVIIVLTILRIKSVHWWVAFVLSSPNVLSLNNHNICHSASPTESLNYLINTLSMKRMGNQNFIIVFMLEGFPQGWKTDSAHRNCSGLGKKHFAKRQWQFTQLTCPNRTDLCLFKVAKIIACEHMNFNIVSTHMMEG